MVTDVVTVVDEDGGNGSTQSTTTVHSTAWGGMKKDVSLQAYSAFLNGSAQEFGSFIRWLILVVS